MRIRIMRAIGLALVVHAVASCGTRAAAQDPEECEPVTAESVDVVADRFSLNAVQRRWLEDRQRSGKLEDPADLDPMPGAGPGLIEDLAGAFCWGKHWEGEGRVSTRRRSGEAQREILAGLERESLTFRGRGRRRFDSTREVRGSFALRHEGWELLLGHVRSRRALGLLMATPGAEPRGGPALGPAGAGWGTSLSLDPDLPLGMVVSGDHPSGNWKVAVVRGAGNRFPGWWGSGGWSGTVGGAELGAIFLPGPGGGSGSLWIHQPQPSGGWSGEWAWGAAGTSQGAAWGFRTQALGIRAGVYRRSASFHVPVMRRIRTPQADETVGIQIEIKWRPGTGRFLAFRFEDGRKPGRPWMRFRSVQELEWKERIAVGLGLGLVWRSTVTESLEPRNEQRKLRAELSYHRSGWRLRFRGEERVSGTGRARLRSLRLGRRGRVSWELRADMLSEAGEGPLVWTYRRRAGGIFGWDAHSPGNWLGAWVEFSWMGLRVEVSADAGARGWDWIGALQVPIGRLDPGPRGP